MSYAQDIASLRSRVAELEDARTDAERTWEEAHAAAVAKLSEMSDEQLEALRAAECAHCGCLNHGGVSCPRVRRLRYADQVSPSGRPVPVEVEFWPRPEWLTPDLIFKSDTFEAASRRVPSGPRELKVVNG